MAKSVARFRTTFLDSKAPESNRNAELLGWCESFAAEGLAESKNEYNAGNLSFRSEHGMIITASGANLAKIQKEGLVEVVECDTKKFALKAAGLAEPSSESFLHWEIYRRRPAVNAIFHGHCDLILKHAKALKITGTKHEQPFGSIELLKEILNVLGDRNFIVVKKHGFISLGQTMDEAGERAIKKLLEANELEEKKK